MTILAQIALASIILAFLLVLVKIYLSAKETVGDNSILVLNYICLGLCVVSMVAAVADCIATLF